MRVAGLGGLAHQGYHSLKVSNMHQNGWNILFDAHVFILCQTYKHGVTWNYPLTLQNKVLGLIVDCHRYDMVLQGHLTFRV